MDSMRALVLPRLSFPEIGVEKPLCRFQCNSRVLVLGMSISSRSEVRLKILIFNGEYQKFTQYW